MLRNLHSDIKSRLVDSLDFEYNVSSTDEDLDKTVYWDLSLVHFDVGSESAEIFDVVFSERVFGDGCVESGRGVVRDDDLVLGLAADTESVVDVVLLFVDGDYEMGIDD